MTIFLLTLYVLIWPLIVAGVLFFIARGFIRDWREARRQGRSLV